MIFNEMSDVTQLRNETSALEELSRQLFLESVDLHNTQVGFQLKFSIFILYLLLFLVMSITQIPVAPCGHL